MREEVKKRIEKIRKLVKLAEMTGKGYSVSITIHSQHDEEVTEASLEILKGMKIQAYKANKYRWFNLHDAKDEEGKVLAKLQVSVFYPGGKEEEAKWLKHFSDISSEV